MRAWPGILLLTSDPFGLRALVGLLKHPLPAEFHCGVLGILFEVMYLEGVPGSGVRGYQGPSVDVVAARGAALIQDL